VAVAGREYGEIRGGETRGYERALQEGNKSNTGGKMLIGKERIHRPLNWERWPSGRGEGAASGARL